jgi:anthranilate synthase/aminodeoxychorismate synthase-like glutamine amidotransferase
MILLIDNFDSFTYNIAHYLQEIGSSVRVVRNNAISIREIKAINPLAIIISPGPSHPSNSGICKFLVQELASDIPMLGICLGHQIIAHTFGADIIKLPKPNHGKVVAIFHDSQGIFNDIPNNIPVALYHSLAVKKSSLSKDFKVTAKANFGDEEVVMAISHTHHNLHGVQFHPESIVSKYGHKLLHNFLIRCINNN